MTGGKIYEGSSCTHNIGRHQRDYACCHGSPHGKISGIRTLPTLYIYVLHFKVEHLQVIHKPEHDSVAEDWFQKLVPGCYVFGDQTSYGMECK